MDLYHSPNARQIAYSGHLVPPAHLRIAGLSPQYWLSCSPLSCGDTLSTEFREPEDRMEDDAERHFFDRTTDVPKIVGCNVRNVEYRWNIYVRHVSTVPEDSDVL